jgi:hypothetical protein
VDFKSNVVPLNLTTDPSSGTNVSLVAGLPKG